MYLVNWKNNDKYSPIFTKQSSDKISSSDDTTGQYVIYV